MTAGVDGLLRDKTRPSRVPPLGREAVERVVALTQGDPPGEATHWTAAAMAEVTAISVSSVQRIWRTHGLQPHRMRQFKLSNDPHFAAKLREQLRSDSRRSSVGAVEHEPKSVQIQPRNGGQQECFIVGAEGIVD